VDNELSLFFELAEGRKADLEIISAAAIAWVETLRAAARAIEPESDVKVELIDADEGSLIYNTVVDWFERNVEPKLERIQRGSGRLPRSKKLLLGFAPFLLVTAVPTYDHYFRDGQFTDSDRDMLKRIEHDITVEAARRKFYRTLEREPAITAVGVKEHRGDEPLALVPSSAFPEAGGLWAIEHDGDQVQITNPVLEVVLVKPALVHTPRAWTFKPQGLPEFDAVMRDPVILRAIQSGGLPVRLQEGIPMTIRLEVREVLVDGQWKLTRGGRSVIRVISPKMD
jgi:hypothetical protein